jgi:hypothetical protein
LEQYIKYIEIKAEDFENDNNGNMVKEEIEAYLKLINSKASDKRREHTKRRATMKKGTRNLNRQSLESVCQKLSAMFMADKTKFQ